MIQEEIKVELENVASSDVSEIKIDPLELKLGVTDNSTIFYRLFTRTIEIIFSFVLLVLTAPLLLLCCLLVVLESPGGALYHQERLGLNNKPFKIYKIRSMYINSEINGPQWAKSNDSRVTRVGKIIRKTRIDELPQLINVLKGEMSVIGPRPEREFFITQFSNEVPEFHLRTLVKPGLTGLAQVDGGYDLNFKEKLEKDLYYIQNKNFKMDLYIIVKTVKIVLIGEGAR